MSDLGWGSGCSVCKEIWENQYFRFACDPFPTASEYLLKNLSFDWLTNQTENSRSSLLTNSAETARCTLKKIAPYLCLYSGHLSFFKSGVFWVLFLFLGQCGPHKWEKEIICILSENILERKGVQQSKLKKKKKFNHALKYRCLCCCVSWLGYTKEVQKWVYLNVIGWFSYNSIKKALT